MSVMTPTVDVGSDTLQLGGGMTYRVAGGSFMAVDPEELQQGAAVLADALTELDLARMAMRRLDNAVVLTRERALAVHAAALAVTVGVDVTGIEVTRYQQDLAARRMRIQQVAAQLTQHVDALEVATDRLRVRVDEGRGDLLTTATDYLGADARVAGLFSPSTGTLAHLTGFLAGASPTHPMRWDGSLDGVLLDPLGFLMMNLGGGDIRTGGHLLLPDGQVAAPAALTGLAAVSALAPGFLPYPLGAQVRGFLGTGMFDDPQVLVTAREDVMLHGTGGQLDQGGEFIGEALALSVAGVAWAAPKVLPKVGAAAGRALGAAAGAALGAPLGIPGIVVGAVIGGVLGFGGRHVGREMGKKVQAQLPPAALTLARGEAVDQQSSAFGRAVFRGFVDRADPDGWQAPRASEGQATQTCTIGMLDLEYGRLAQEASTDLDALIRSTGEIKGQIGNDDVGVVRVTSAEHADGSAVRLVQIPGTSEWGTGGEHPHDMLSNIRGVAQWDTALEQQVQAALDQSGAQAGDTVVLVGHSGGAIAAAGLAADPVFGTKYDVSHVLAVGGPIGTAQIPESTAVLSLEHAQDPVAALGGHQLPPSQNHVTIVMDGGGPFEGREDLHLSGPYADMAGELGRAGVQEYQHFEQGLAEVMRLDEPGTQVRVRDFVGVRQ